MSQMPPSSGSYTPPPSRPPGGSTPSSSDRNLMLVLSYLWLASLIPLFTKKDDAEIQWHAKNGLALAIADIVANIVLYIISNIPVLGCGALIGYCVVGVGYVVLIIVCIMKAVNGQRLRIPLVSDMAEKINL
jgi:uncharacterized membrane protein